MEHCAKIFVVYAIYAWIYDVGNDTSPKHKNKAQKLSQWRDSRKTFDAKPVTIRFNLDPYFVMQTLITSDYNNDSYLLRFSFRATAMNDRYLWVFISKNNTFSCCLKFRTKASERIQLINVRLICYRKLFAFIKWKKNQFGKTMKFVWMKNVEIKLDFRMLTTHFLLLHFASKLTQKFIIKEGIVVEIMKQKTQILQSK